MQDETLYTQNIGSHLTRGAWIEISVQQTFYGPSASHLTQGAWIEIRNLIIIMLCSKFKLTVVKLGVKPVFLNQLIMAAAFNNVTVSHDQYQVGISDG